ncbi:methyltransferase domain-containing protein [Halalkalicoccus salilacus]|uniref:methyltransferase domain-containing protein n=1 Tax=Halalkalicoccus salilacus TaxID=3117459 RepID=UPI00300E72B4
MSASNLLNKRWQLEKAHRFRDEAGFENVAFEKGYIEKRPFEDESFDVVVSNGVTNLSAERDRVLSEYRTPVW